MVLLIWGIVRKMMGKMVNLTRVVNLIVGKVGKGRRSRKI
jgi:hypothetical protein